MNCVSSSMVHRYPRKWRTLPLDKACTFITMLLTLLKRGLWMETILSFRVHMQGIWTRSCPGSFQQNQVAPGLFWYVGHSILKRMPTFCFADTRMVPDHRFCLMERDGLDQDPLICLKKSKMSRANWKSFVGSRQTRLSPEKASRFHR